MVILVGQMGPIEKETLEVFIATGPLVVISSIIVVVMVATGVEEDIIILDTTDEELDVQEVELELMTATMEEEDGRELVVQLVLIELEDVEQEVELELMRRASLLSAVTTAAAMMATNAPKMDIWTIFAAV